MRCRVNGRRAISKRDATTRSRVHPRAVRRREIPQGLGRTTAPTDVDIYNPAFDVTPADLVTAIITEHGIAWPPYGESLGKLGG